MHSTGLLSLSLLLQAAIAVPIVSIGSSTSETIQVGTYPSGLQEQGFFLGVTVELGGECVCIFPFETSNVFGWQQSSCSDLQIKVTQVGNVQSHGGACGTDHRCLVYPSQFTNNIFEDAVCGVIIENPPSPPADFCQGSKSRNVWPCNLGNNKPSWINEPFLSVSPTSSSPTTFPPQSFQLGNSNPSPKSNVISNNIAVSNNPTSAKGNAPFSTRIGLVVSASNFPDPTETKGSIPTTVNLPVNQLAANPVSGGTASDAPTSAVNPDATPVPTSVLGSAPTATSSTDAAFTNAQVLADALPTPSATATPTGLADADALPTPSTTVTPTGLADADTLTSTGSLPLSATTA